MCKNVVLSQFKNHIPNPLRNRENIATKSKRIGLNIKKGYHFMTLKLNLIFKEPLRTWRGSSSSKCIHELFLDVQH